MPYMPEKRHCFEGLYNFDRVVHKISGIQKMGKNLVYTVCTCKISTTLKAYMLVIFSQNLIKLGQVGPYDLRDSKNGQKLVYTVCTCKMSTALKAYMSVIFGQNLIKLGQGGPYDLRDSKNGQRFGLYRMHLQNGYHFGGLFLSHFWSELNKT